jgi:hypothetical protein
VAKENKKYCSLKKEGIMHEIIYGLSPWKVKSKGLLIFLLSLFSPGELCESFSFGTLSGAYVPGIRIAGYGKPGAISIRTDNPRIAERKGDILGSIRAIFQ